MRPFNLSAVLTVRLVVLGALEAKSTFHLNSCYCVLLLSSHLLRTHIWPSKLCVRLSSHHAHRLYIQYRQRVLVVALFLRLFTCFRTQTLVNCHANAPLRVVLKRGRHHIFPRCQHHFHINSTITIFDNAIPTGRCIENRAEKRLSSLGKFASKKQQKTRCTLWLALAYSGWQCSNVDQTNTDRQLIHCTPCKCLNQSINGTHRDRDEKVICCIATTTKNPPHTHGSPRPLQPRAL